MENNTLNNTFYVNYDISKFTKTRWFNIVGNSFNIKLEGILLSTSYNKELTSLELLVKKAPGEFHNYTVYLQRIDGVPSVTYEENGDVIKAVLDKIKQINGKENDEDIQSSK